jgi:hypothetical protein
MTPISDKPGRKLIRGRWVWVACNDARRSGFRPKTQPLPDDEADHPRICQRLWAEMLAWLQSPGRRAVAYDGTISSLSELYQRSDASPFHSVEPKTQRQYSYTLSRICAAVGARRVDHLTGDDFRRWHGKWSAAGLRTGQEHVKMLRIIMNYGAEQRLAGCATSADILSRIQFPTPGKRSVFLERSHVEAIIETCLARGDLVSRSIALCQAIQFETTLRQTDVIGIWRPRPRALDVQPGMVVTHRHYWADGLTYERIIAGRIVGASIKEGEAYDYPLAMMPMTSRILSLVPESERRGPLAAEEIGSPMSADRFRKTWRRIATLAGVPSRLWNRDTRSGGITEATDAGVDLETTRHLAGHKQTATTAGYSRNKAAKIERAMKARMDAAQGENAHGNAHGNNTVTARDAK